MIGVNWEERTEFVAALNTPNDASGFECDRGPTTLIVGEWLG